MNKITAFIKSHPMESALVVGAIAVFFYLITRSGSSSSSAATDYLNATQANNAANTQAAIAQAQLDAQTQQAAYAAQASNNQTAAQLAAAVAQYNVQGDTAKLAAQVQMNQDTLAANAYNNQTQAQSAIANNYISTAGSIQQAEIQAQQANSAQILNTVKSGGGNGGIFYGQSATTNEALLAALALSQPGGINAVPSAEGALVGGQNASAYSTASMWAGISSIVSSGLKALFG